MRSHRIAGAFLHRLNACHFNGRSRLSQRLKAQPSPAQRRSWYLTHNNKVVVSVEGPVRATQEPLVPTSDDNHRLRLRCPGVRPDNAIYAEKSAHLPQFIVDLPKTQELPKRLRGDSHRGTTPQEDETKVRQEAAQGDHRVADGV